MVSNEVEYFLRLVKTYFQLKYRLPRTRRTFEKGVYDRLLRDFALAARLDVPKGSRNAVYLHAILKLSESDFKSAMGDYALKTKDLDFGPTPMKGIPDFWGKVSASGESISFRSYIEDLREKRQLERFFMDFAKDTEETREKQLEKELEEESVNNMIKRCKITGWDWPEKTEREGDEKRGRRQVT